MAQHDMSPDRVRRLVAQDARAWGQLGVAWGLRGDASRVPAASSAPETVQPEPEPQAQPEPIPRNPMKLTQPPAAQIEAKPMPTPTGTPAEVAQHQLAQILQDYTEAAPHLVTGTPHTTIVFGEGDPCARIMFVGEAPGADEDRLGRPFVGRAGQKLEQMIIAMGLQREDVYIANVLKVRPPNNATPTLEEAQACAPYLMRQIEVIQPEAIVALGLPSARLLTQQTLSMRDLRGRWWPMATPSGQEFQVLPTYHPAYLLRNYTPETRRKVWEDLKCVLERLQLPVPDR
ncbi:MAG: uracil-DNA glycosylase family protein [Phycisphaerales bacterium]